MEALLRERRLLPDAFEGQAGLPVSHWRAQEICLDASSLADYMQMMCED